jgi:hypothetical protein
MRKSSEILEHKRRHKFDCTSGHSQTSIILRSDDDGGGQALGPIQPGYHVLRAVNGRPARPGCHCFRFKTSMFIEITNSYRIQALAQAVREFTKLPVA